MKVEIGLPELQEHEYTGEYRHPKKGEIYFDYGIAILASDDRFGEYPILRKKTKPKIIIYRWMVSSNSSRRGAEKGYRIMQATEDYMEECGRLYGWVAKKLSEAPVEVYDGEFL
jgi:hypothetical protein